MVRFALVVARAFAAGRVFFALAARRGADVLAVSRFRAFVVGFFVDFLLLLLVVVRVTFLAAFFEPRAVRFPVARAAARCFLRGAFARRGAFALRGAFVPREAVRDRDFFDLGFFVFTTHILRKSQTCPTPVQAPGSVDPAQSGEVTSADTHTA